MSAQRKSAARVGLTLLETLVVVMLLVVGLGLALPAVQKARAAMARVHCASQLRQLALAVHAFGSDSRESLPQGCGYPFLHDPEQVSVQSGVSWHTRLLPYVEQEALGQLAWAAHEHNPSGVSPEHEAVMTRSVPVFVCPADGRRAGSYPNGRVWGLTSYVGVAGTEVNRNDGSFHSRYDVRFADVTDGLSNTLMLGERPPGPGGIYGAWYAEWGTAVCSLAQILSAGTTPWLPSEGIGCRPSGSALRPGQVAGACDVNHFWSFHPAGANFAFVDGSVRFLTYSGADLLPALATRAGGEVVATP